MAHRQFAEALQIGGQSPGEFVVDADPAFSVHRRNYRNDHTDTCVSSGGRPKLWIIVTAQANKAFAAFEAESRLSSSDIFAKKHCCLRIVVITFARDVTALPIQSDCGFEIVITVQVDPFQTFAPGELLLRIQQRVRNTLSTSFGPHVETFALSSERNGREPPQHNASDSFLSQISDPDAGRGVADDLLNGFWGVALNDASCFVILLQKSRRVGVCFRQANDPNGRLLSFTQDRANF